MSLTEEQLNSHLSGFREVLIFRYVSQENLTNKSACVGALGYGRQRPELNSIPPITVAH